MKITLLTLAFSLVLTLVYSQEKRHQVVIETDSGNIVLELYNQTPLHRDNFLKLANEGFYDGVSFHRIIKDFMIQGGNPATKEGAATKTDGPGYTIPAEINSNLFHKKGALCAARQADNVNPNRASSGSQFYIVQGKTFTLDELKQFEARTNADVRTKAIQAFFAAQENKEYLMRMKEAQDARNQDEIKAIMDEISPIIDARMEQKLFAYSKEQIDLYTTIGGTPHLDLMYTVFGEVVEGLDVVDRIAAAKTRGDAPLSVIRMTVKVID